MLHLKYIHLENVKEIIIRNDKKKIINVTSKQEKNRGLQPLQQKIHRKNKFKIYDGDIDIFVPCLVKKLDPT